VSGSRRSAYGLSKYVHQHEKNRTRLPNASSRTWPETPCSAIAPCTRADRTEDRLAEDDQGEQAVPLGDVLAMVTRCEVLPLHRGGHHGGDHQDTGDLDERQQPVADVVGVVGRG